MPGSGLKVYGGGGVRTKFSVQLWSQAEQLFHLSKKQAIGFDIKATQSCCCIYSPPPLLPLKISPKIFIFSIDASPQ